MIAALIKLSCVERLHCRSSGSMRELGSGFMPKFTGFAERDLNHVVLGVHEDSGRGRSSFGKLSQVDEGITAFRLR